MKIYFLLFYSLYNATYVIHKMIRMSLLQNSGVASVIVWRDGNFKTNYAKRDPPFWWDKGLLLKRNWSRVSSLFVLPLPMCKQVTQQMLAADLGLPIWGMVRKYSFINYSVSYVLLYNTKWTKTYNGKLIA
jgi:hypothetical protein